MKTRNIIAAVMITMTLLMPGATAVAKRIDKSTVKAVTNKYKVRDPEFEVVNLGGFSTWLLKASAGAHGLRDEMAFLKGVKSMYVIDYEDCSRKVNDGFNREMSNLLKNAEIIMETKEDGSVTRIYGHPSPDGSKVSDVIVFSPNDGAMVCIFGTMDVEALSEYVSGKRDDDDD